MPKTETPVQTDPAVPSTGDGSAPQTNPDVQPQSALEALALAGDENARRILGQPTASGVVGTADALRTAGSDAGFVLGEAAPRDVYVDLDGNVSDGSASKDDGFRGSQIAVEGAVVDAATLRNLQAAGVI